MEAEDVKNQIVDIAKRNNMNRFQKLQQLTDLLKERFGSEAEEKAREMLLKFRIWEDYTITLLSEAELTPKNTNASNSTYRINASKYFDLIQFYILYKSKFDEITDEEIQDGILRTKQLKEIAEKKKREGEKYCEIYRINIALFFVPDTNMKFITISRFVAVLGYMNATRRLRAISSLAKQIDWDNCSVKIQTRKHLFFNGCEHLLASIMMGSGPEFDQDDIAFLYGATTIVEYLTYHNVFKKKNPSALVENIPTIEEWLVLEPPTNYSFKKKYPDLETFLQTQLDRERDSLVENMIKNARVKRHERNNFGMGRRPGRRHRVDSDGSTDWPIQDQLADDQVSSCKLN